MHGLLFVDTLLKWLGGLLDNCWFIIKTWWWIICSRVSPDHGRVNLWKNPTIKRTSILMDAFSSVFDRGPSIFTSSQVAEINHKW